MSFVRRFAVLAAAAVLAATPLAAWSQGAAPTLEQFKAANEAVAAAVTAKPNDLPLLSDPVFGPKLRIAFDMRALTLFNFADPVVGIETCMPSLTSVQVYALGSAVNGTQAEQQAAAARNSLRHHDEQALIFSFAIECFGRIVPSLEALWAGLDPTTQAARKPGVESIRNGTTQIYGGGLLMLSEAPYTLANRTQILTVLARNGDRFAAIMTPAQRTETIARIDSLSAAAHPSLKADLARLRASMSTKVCKGLCLV